MSIERREWLKISALSAGALAFSFALSANARNNPGKSIKLSGNEKPYGFSFPQNNAGKNR